MSSAATSSACTEKEIRVVQPADQSGIQQRIGKHWRPPGDSLSLRTPLLLGWARKTTKKKAAYKARPEGTFPVAEVSPNYFGGCVPCGFGVAGAVVAGLGAGVVVVGLVPGIVGLAPAAGLVGAGTPD